MASTRQPPATDRRPSLGTLFAGITGELRAIVRGEIDLAKAELRRSAHSAAAGGALLAVAGVLALMVWLLATWAAVYGLTDGTELPLWASFLIVAGVYLLIAIIVGLIGARRLRKARGPQVAVAEMQRTKQIVESIPPGTPPVPASARKPPAFPI